MRYKGNQKQKRENTLRWKRMKTPTEKIRLAETELQKEFKPYRALQQLEHRIKLNCGR
jgi:hypothetical protein